MPDSATLTAEFDVVSARIDHKVVMVDAAMAARWLKRNTNNRNVRQSVVARYRADMAAGRWPFAGDPIRFDTEGNLLDGQHRLTALSELEGVTLPLLVIRGLPAESQGVMDQGSRRTPGDQLGLRGVKDANHVAASIKVFLTWQGGFLFRDSKAATAAITTPLIEEFVTHNPTDVANIGAMATVVKQNDAPPSVSGAAAIAFARVDALKAVEFFTLLARGAGTEGHPIVTLDKRLQRHRREGIKVPARDNLAFFILAWNAWRDGRQMTKFQRPRGGRWAEDNFPEPH